MSFFELYLVTFNCARELIDPSTFAPNLFSALPSSSQDIPDIFAISLQEIAPIAYSFLGGSYLTPYFDRITSTVQLAAKIRTNEQATLEHVVTRSLGMTAIMVFAKPEFAQRVQWIQSAAAGVGLWNMGNKGAVGVRIGLSIDSQTYTTEEANGERILTLTAAHLAPHEPSSETRNKDWENIVRNLVFINNDHSGYTFAEENKPLLSSSLSAPSAPPPDNTGLYDAGSHIFFAGDLNYRTRDIRPVDSSHLSFPQPVSSPSSPFHFSHLLETDQLNRERTANRTLHGFQENPIAFPPTYKYSSKQGQHLNTLTDSPNDHEAEEYWAWASHRWPSYCDRILYVLSSSSQSKPRTYTALPVQRTSDHRPVALSARIKLEPVSAKEAREVQEKRPFDINPYWRSRKSAARQLEIVVGIASYLALTKKGNTLLAVIGGLVFASWYMAYWIRAA
ncbi:DNase I-like protein [Delitschia confertaspora ATCC 74209]|uniref:DNase I-like protein n=1 Tax=Delitschia confertaspora ATCC 74209 TaxID=1513339 RepID=A0A9P4JFK9_9PLEO|nr:DNase I-like protein [Delitschia confertaspora ATCC 74209]